MAGLQLESRLRNKYKACHFPLPQKLDVKSWKLVGRHWQPLYTAKVVGTCCHETLKGKFRGWPAWLSGGMLRGITDLRIGQTPYFGHSEFSRCLALATVNPGKAAGVPCTKTQWVPPPVPHRNWELTPNSGPRKAQFPVSLDSGFAEFRPPLVPRRSPRRPPRCPPRFSVTQLAHSRGCNLLARASTCPTWRVSPRSCAAAKKGPTREIQLHQTANPGRYGCVMANRYSKITYHATHHIYGYFFLVDLILLILSLLGFSTGRIALRLMLRQLLSNLYYITCFACIARCARSASLSQPPPQLGRRWMEQRPHLGIHLEHRLQHRLEQHRPGTPWP